MLFRRFAQNPNQSLKSLSLFRRPAKFFGVGDTVTVRDALNQALFEELEQDSNVHSILFTQLFTHMTNIEIVISQPLSCDSHSSPIHLLILRSFSWARKWPNIKAPTKSPRASSTNSAPNE